MAWEGDELGSPVHVETVTTWYVISASPLLSDPTHWVHQVLGELFHDNVLDHIVNTIALSTPDSSAWQGASCHRFRCC